MIELSADTSSRTVGDSVYQSLRSAVLSLQLAPGQVLNAKDIAQQLNISRSPVRDALMRLNSESLVDIWPQRGCRVSVLDPDRISHELFFRQSLQQMAMTRFIPIAAEEHLQAMEAAINLQKQAISAGDSEQNLHSDSMFHAVPFRAIGEEYSLALIDRQCVHYHRFRLLASRYENNTRLSMREHELILDAIRRQDVSACLALMHTHMHHLDEQRQRIAALEPDFFA